jgi:hypothetical protein
LTNQRGEDNEDQDLNAVLSALTSAVEPSPTTSTTVVRKSELNESVCDTANALEKAVDIDDASVPTATALVKAVHSISINETSSSPKVSMSDNVKTPNVKTPNVKPPNVKTPNVKTPNVKTPNVKTLTRKTPALSTSGNNSSGSSASKSASSVNSFNSLTCEECGSKCATKGGLTSHMRDCAFIKRLSKHTCTFIHKQYCCDKATSSYISPVRMNCA